MRYISPISPYISLYLPISPQRPRSGARAPPLLQPASTRQPPTCFPPPPPSSNTHTHTPPLSPHPSISPRSPLDLPSISPSSSPCCLAPPHASRGGLLSQARRDWLPWLPPPTPPPLHPSSIHPTPHPTQRPIPPTTPPYSHFHLLYLWMSIIPSAHTLRIHMICIYLCSMYLPEH